MIFLLPLCAYDDSVPSAKYVKNNGVMDGVMDFESTEYSSHALTNNVNQENGNEWFLVTISSDGKKMWTTY